MKTTLNYLVFVLSITFSLPSLAATRDVLQKIADNANVANGSADVSKKPSFTEMEGMKLFKYWQKRWDNCTFSAPYPTKEKAFASVLKYSQDGATIEAIKKLDRAGRVANVFGFETDNDIACSQVWLNVYTIDGYVLELWYGLGD